MIEINKQYQLANGREFRLYAVDGGGLFPVQGAYLDPNGTWQVQFWTSEGRFSGSYPDHKFNLVEIRPRHKRTVWINCYPDLQNGVAYVNKPEADMMRSPNSIGCVECTFEFEEGEGL